MKKLQVFILMVFTLGVSSMFAQTPSATLVYSYQGNDSCAQDGTNPTVQFQLQNPQNVDSFYVDFGNYQTFAGDAADASGPFTMTYFYGNTFVVKVRLVNTSSGNSSFIVISVPIYKRVSPFLMNVPDSVCVGETFKPYINLNSSDYMSLTGISWQVSNGYTASNVRDITTSFSAASSPADTVSVTVQSVCGTSTASSVIVAGTPFQSFNYSTLPDTICPGREVYFNIYPFPTHMGRELTYVVNWGDGSTDSLSSSNTSVSFSHNYSTTGKKYIQMKLVSHCGSPVVKTDSVVIGNSASAFNAWNPVLSYWGADTLCSASVIEVYPAMSGAKHVSIDWGDGNIDAGYLNAAEHQYSSPGSYDIIATFTDGCGNTKNDTLTIVIVNTTGYAPTPFVSLSNSNACPNSNISIYLTNLLPGSVCVLDFGDGTDTTFVASQNYLTFLHQYTSAGSYTISLSEITSCGDTLSNTANLVVGDANLLASTSLLGPNVLCTGGNANFTLYNMLVSNGNYASIEWNMGDGTVYMDTNYVSHSYASAGIYTILVKITDLCGNIHSQAHTVKVQNSLIPQKSVSISPASNMCQGEAFYLYPNVQPSASLGDTLVANYGDGYSDTLIVQSGTISFMHKYPTAGTFTGNVILLTACGGTDTAVYTINIKPAPTATISVNDSILCVGETVVLSAQPTNNLPSQYAWRVYDPNGNSVPADTGASSSLLLTEPGAYNVELLSAGGSCGYGMTDNISIVVRDTNISPTASFTATPSANNISITNNSTDADYYFWDFGDGNTAWGNVSGHSYASAGTFTITLIAYRCDTTASAQTDTATQVVNITTSIEQINARLTKIYPNPATTNLTIETPQGNAEVIIMDLLGKTLIKKAISRTTEQISVAELPSGIYFLEVRWNGNKETHKLIIR